MDQPDRSTTRRTFIRYGILGVATACVAAVAGFFAGRGLRKQPPETGTTPLGDQFKYDLSELARIDPSLLIYGPTRTIDTGQANAKDMQIGPDGRIYVAAGQAITVLETDGSQRTLAKLTETPQGIAWDDKQRMYVGARDHVEVYDAQATRLAAWPTIAGTPHITSIAVTGDNVFVADAGSRLVTHYNTGGELLGHIGQEGNHFIVPSPYFDVRVGPDGLLWVANTGRHRMEAYTLEGAPVRTWGKASTAIDGFCGCCNPCHFDILPDGRFITSEKGLARVKVYHPDGRFQGVIAGPETAGATVTGLGCAAADASVTLPAAATGKGNRVFVLHAATGQLTEFAPIPRPEHETTDGSTD